LIIAAMRRMLVVGLIISHSGCPQGSVHCRATRTEDANVIASSAMQVGHVMPVTKRAS
jgi:hypothetical protein